MVSSLTHFLQGFPSHKATTCLFDCNIKLLYLHSPGYYTKLQSTSYRNTKTQAISFDAIWEQGVYKAKSNFFFKRRHIIHQYQRPWVPLKCQQSHEHLFQITKEFFWALKICLILTIIMYIKDNIYRVSHKYVFLSCHWCLLMQRHIGSNFASYWRAFCYIPPPTPTHLHCFKEFGICHCCWT